MKSELAVGDSTWIELIFTTGTNKSTVNKSAKVTTNDTIVGGVNISFKVDVAEPTDTSLKLVANPFELNFGPIEKKRRPKLETYIVNKSNENMDLQVVAFPPDYFKKVELDDDALKPGDETKLKVELTRAREEEQFRKIVTIEGRYGANKTKFRLSIPVIKGIEVEGAANKGPTATKK